MKAFKTIGLLLITIFFANHSRGQLWKQYSDSAKFYQGQKNMDKAIEFYKREKEELEKDSLGTVSWAAMCNKLANFYINIRQFKKAELQYLETMQMLEKVLGKMHPEYAASCNNLATFYQNTGDYEKAELRYLEGKQIREKVLGKENADYAASCNNLANLYSVMGQYEKAEPLHLEANHILEKVLGRKHPDYGISCSNLANFYSMTGSYKKAAPLYIEAKQILEVLGKEHPDYASSCINLATFYQNIGEYKQAEPLFLEAKQIQEKAFGKEHLVYAGSCNRLANLYSYMGEFEKAIFESLEAKQIKEKLLGKEDPEYAASCDNLAMIYRKMKEYEKAVSLYLEVKQLKEKVMGKEHPSYANTCDILADLYQNMGQYEKVEPLFLEAKQIQEKAFGKDNLVYAGICHRLAKLYADMGKFEKAMSESLEAKQVKEKLLGKEHPDYAVACYNLASIYKKMKEYDKAESLYIEIKQINEKGRVKEQGSYTTSCNFLADLYQNMGQYEKAERLYKEVKQLREKVLGKQDVLYGLTCKKLADLYCLLNQPLKADKEFKDFFSVPFNHSSLLMRMAYTNTIEGPKAQTMFKSTPGDNDDTYSFYVSTKLKSDIPYSLSLFHHNNIISNSLALKKLIFSSSDTALIKYYNEWLSLKKYLSILYTTHLNEKKEDVTKLEEKCRQMEKNITHVSLSFVSQRRWVGWKEIKYKLQADEASIEFASFHYSYSQRLTDTVLYVALVLRKDNKLPTTVVLFNENQLTGLLSASANKANNDSVENLDTSRGVIVNGTIDAYKSIYDLLWKPLEKELKGIKTIYYAPSGMLHKIAFAALPISNTEVLSDRYKLVQFVTTASVAEEQPSAINPSDKLQLYGSIKYDVDTTGLRNAVPAYHNEKSTGSFFSNNFTRSGVWPDLPGTKNETDGIELLSGKYLANIKYVSGSDATEENIKALDGKASPVVLHIATHGFFFPDPKEQKNNQQNIENGESFKLNDDPMMRSGLLFAGANAAWQNKPIDGTDDGILTAYEVSNLYLPNTKLVVLSACETGLGDIQGSEGVYGLQRAFKMAGAQNLVMSLWKVPDVETAEFMQQFYKNLFAKQTISDAFYNAQGVMKNKYRKEPYKWAAWVLVR